MRRILSDFDLKRFQKKWSRPHFLKSQSIDMELKSYENTIPEYLIFNEFCKTTENFSLLKRNIDILMEEALHSSKNGKVVKSSSNLEYQHDEHNNKQFVSTLEQNNLDFDSSKKNDLGLPINFSSQRMTKSVSQNDASTLDEPSQKSYVSDETISSSIKVKVSTSSQNEDTISDSTLSKPNHTDSSSLKQEEVLSEKSGGKFFRERRKKGCIECDVSIFDRSSKTFYVGINAKGAELVDAVCSHLDILEKEYFGLMYQESGDEKFWLICQKKITSQLKSQSHWKFEFQVKFYLPEPVHLVDDLTRYYLCLQIRQDIVNAKLPCTFFTYALLASYTVQSELGDYDSAVHDHPDYIQSMRFSPPQFHNDELLNCIHDLHKLHKGQHPQESDRNFLYNATKLAMYGVSLHDAMNSFNETVSIGVYYDGVLLYRDKLRIKQILWSKIIKVSYKKAIFRITIRKMENEVRNCTTELRFATKKLAKRLWRTIVEYHDFFRLKHSDKYCTFDSSVKNITQSQASMCKSNGSMIMYLSNAISESDNESSI